jgi:RNA polymerase sigma-70 factor (ECF subfamily)
VAEGAARGGGRAVLAPLGLEAAFEQDRGLLFGMLYRLTGSTADAEDLVQSTFERALERPPTDTTRPWRPWLVRVAVNLGRDHLRRRRRRGYDGPWLPAPVETPDDTLRFGVPEPATTQGRYELMESVSYAFLLALEELTPTQRAVLLLRDVFEYSGRETALALEVSEAGVRQHLRRARQAMAGYDAARPGRERPSESAARAVLGRFLEAIAGGDAKAVEALLAEDVVLRTDAGGEFHAARVDVVGRAKVARFYINISKLSPRRRVGLRRLNGSPGILLEIDEPKPGISPRVATVAALDADGRLATIYSVLSTRKLRGVAPLDR